MTKIGLYFGSFNPVHIGHMAIAGYMTEFAGLDQVWFIVSPQNPLKKKETLLGDHHRLCLAQLAIGDNDRIKASDIEFKLPVPSYTIDTLTYLKESTTSMNFVWLWEKITSTLFINGKMLMSLRPSTPFMFIPGQIQKDQPHSFLIKYLHWLISIT